MTNMPEDSTTHSYWFVGAMYGGTDDQLPRFLRDGIWENGYVDKYVDLVKAIQPGDRIAIKSAYTRKHNIPFDNREQSVSVMAIKAIGTVTANPGNGRTVKVEWMPLDSPREWYFYTHRGTIWRVQPGEWMADALIAFTFEYQPQDYEQFRNAPRWRERFGDGPSDKRRFHWTKFYEAVADSLLAHQHDRSEVIEAIHEIEGISSLQDKLPDGRTEPLRDICPFTVMGIFNRGMTDVNRKSLAAELARLLGVEEAVPDTFEGVPILNNQKSWFFSNARSRRDDDIDVLWSAFAAGLNFADSDAPEAEAEFVSAFDEATSRRGVAWNLTFGLYWARPWQFVPLDAKSRAYIVQRLGMKVGRNSQKVCSGNSYLALMESLETRFKEDTFPVHSVPELSLEAWRYDGSSSTGDIDPDEDEDEDEVVSAGESFAPYSVDDILDDGCFVERDELMAMLERIRTKKNVILQGPPGTGKTWLAKRLAFALMGQQAEGLVRAVQFHPNLSYEDFVRGWRPSGDGKLALVDGPFLQMIAMAHQAPETKCVLVIEEINRGQPAQIFGEMLTLLEADKRTPSEALELCYRRDRDEQVSIPSNLYVIGTMNIADRSLALVDLALRRRFAFVDLEPRVGRIWRDWVSRKYGINEGLLDEIQRRIVTLNEEIAADRSLGRQFRIGHSYVTPPVGAQIADPHRWFRQVVETEIGPLLEEYWFDAAEKAHEAKRRLIDGL